VTVADPWGNAFTVVSGSKPEYGPGGFEVVIPGPAAYTLTFLDQAFVVETQDGATILAFAKEGAQQPDPAPEPESQPDLPPNPRPQPAPEAAAQPEPEPADVEQWRKLVQRLARIEELVAQLSERDSK
jgi:hypothetical protein